MVPSEHLPRVADEGEFGWAGRVMEWLRLVARLVWINLLVLAGTLAGGIVLGVFPALAAGSELAARLTAGEPAGQPWRLFWARWRAGFGRLNRLAVPVWAVALVLGLDASVLAAGSGTAVRMLAVPLVLLAIYLAVVLAFLFPVARRYADPFGRTWRFLAVAPLLSPGTAVAVLVVLVAVAAVGLRFVVLVPLLGVSTPLLLTGWLVDARLDRIDERGAP